MVQQEVSISKPTIGIIYPPLEIRNIVDKTASFVARNGPDFEIRIKENEKNNLKFNFLNPGDPYNAYYNFKINEFKDLHNQEELGQNSSDVNATLSKSSVSNQDFVKKLNPIKKITSIYDSVNVDIPKEAPPEYEFMADPPSISAQDLDIVKLTAQFVARNGRQFLSSLMHREARNFQFDFLRPQHSLFNYFTKLVEQYTKILIPPKDIIEKLNKESLDIKTLVSEIKKRELWIKQCKEEKQAAEDLAEKERQAYAQIDWHDFVVVETVDFQPNEFGNFPPPTTPEQVGMRALMREREEEEEKRKKMGVTMLKPKEKENRTSREDNNEVDKNIALTDIAQKIMDEEMGPEEVVVSSSKPENVTKIPSTAAPDYKAPIDTSTIPLLPMPPKAPVLIMPPAPLPTLIGSLEPSSLAHPPKSTQEMTYVTSSPNYSNVHQARESGTTQTVVVTSTGPASETIIIRKDYDPKSKRQVTQPTTSSSEYLVSPITGEKIPAHKMQEHLRFGLLDPQWLEQRERALREKREQEEVYASGVSIGTSLKKLAERRTDIFGAGHKETYIGKKLNESDDNEGWEGEVLTKEPVPASNLKSAPISTMHSNQTEDLEEEILIEDVRETSVKFASETLTSSTSYERMEQGGKLEFQSSINSSSTQLISGSSLVHALQQKKLAAATVMAPPRPPLSIPPPPLGIPPMAAPPFALPHGRIAPPPYPPTGPPPAKKVKVNALEESQLIPEPEFLTHNRHPVRVNIKVPLMPDKPEWKLEGQTFTFTLPLTDNVSVIKAKIYEALNMPAGKQKLQYQGLFIKDSNTLAYYNFNQDSVIELSLKERGGRKK